MECFRCLSRDFRILNFSFSGWAIVACSNCKQAYRIGDKLKLHPIEFLGDVNDDTASDTIMLHCFQCKADRFVRQDLTAEVQHMQYCDRCIHEASKTGSQTIPAGDKIDWNDFLSHFGNQ